MIYIASGALFLSLFLGITAVIRKMGSKEQTLEKLKIYELDSDIKPAPEKFVRKGPVRKLGNWISKQEHDPEKIKKRHLIVKQADVSFTYEEYLIFKALFMGAFAFLTYALSRDLILIITVVIGTFFLPKLYLNQKKKKNIAAFDEQLNDGVILISNALKAGYSFMQALAVAAEETQDPFKKTFKVLLKELSLGMPLEDGLNNLMERMPSEDLNLIVNAILIQRDVGGNLSEILENIAETIRERQKIKNELNTLTAQGKLSGIIIMAMPIFLGGIFYVLNKSYILVLFNTMIGRALLVFAVISQILGWLIIRKIIRIEM